MKAFYFINMYLAGVHCGIQSGHAIDQMWSEYTDGINPDLVAGPATLARKKRREQALTMLKEFSRNHRTFVLLNGGDHLALSELWRFLIDGKIELPFSAVTEPGLNYAATCVGIILPARLYDDKANKCGQIMAAGDVTKKDGTVIPAATMADPDNLYTDWEREFLARKSRCKRAA